MGADCDKSKNGNGKNIYIPVGIVVTMLAVAIGYGELRGAVSAAEKAINEIKTHQEESRQWRESVTKSLTRLEVAAGIRDKGGRG